VARAAYPTTRLSTSRARTGSTWSVAGHMPGAVNLPSVANLAADGRFLDGSAIARRFTDAGVGTGPVLYCGSGITAAQSLLALKSAGVTGAFYPGSWSDWITDPDRPVATGSA
jgi:thiosulfate/3-mercaptopyruvate sulfurtransferase